jgi:hypothetical protein
MLILATEVAQIDWGTVIVQSLITLGVVFGGAGYWEYRRAKMQKKWDEESKKNGVENKVDILSDDVKKINTTIEFMAEDVLELKQDIALLQEANQVTIKYREMRDEQDKVSSIERAAVIESLKAIIRDRLLDAYERCMNKGYYTLEERETYGKLYACYHGEPFEGNGVMEQLREEMLRLPKKKDDATPKKKD